MSKPFLKKFFREFRKSVKLFFFTFSLKWKPGKLFLLFFSVFDFYYSRESTLSASRGGSFNTDLDTEPHLEIITRWVESTVVWLEFRALITPLLSLGLGLCDTEIIEVFNEGKRRINPIPNDRNLTQGMPNDF